MNSGNVHLLWIFLETVPTAAGKLQRLVYLEGGMLNRYSCPSSPRPTITVQFHFPTSTDLMEAFFDSGKVDSIISASLVKEFSWTTGPLPQIL